MSSPARPDNASMTAIRGLLKRNLLERAVALAETRWPGSGPLVELAHEWAVLSPSARRERLAAIGPDELARLRGIGQLQPDLARVLADLEARGIIAPEQPIINEPIAVDAPVTAPPTFEEAIVDAAVDYSEQGLQRIAASAEEQLPPHLEAAIESGLDVRTAREIAEKAAADAAARARERVGLDAPEVNGAGSIELDVPSAEEFLAAEAERRQQAADLAASILDRARSRVDDATVRLLPAVEAVAPVANVPAEVETPDEQDLTTAIDAEVTTLPTTSEESTRVDSSRLEPWRTRLESEPVVVLEPGETEPGDDLLRMIARDMDRGYVALNFDDLGGREFFGGLVREGRRVEPRAGLFATAVSQPNLVAVRGRFYPKAIDRLREGYCDIPGTQATVRVHPGCRIIVLPS